MKLKLSMSLGLLFISSTMAKPFVLNNVVVSGETENIQHIQKVVEYIQKYTGKEIDNERIFHLQREVESILNSNEQNTYRVHFNSDFIDIEKGNIFFYLQEVRNKIFYRGNDDYSTENVIRAIPSLNIEKYYDDGRQWFDLRELSMANENPLKSTFINYQLNPSRRESIMTVSAYSPYGKHYRYISIDNFGSRQLDRFRTTVGYINANLTDRDDVLSINFLSSLKKLNSSYGIGVNYKIPFYKQHQSLTASFTYSNQDTGETDNLAVGIDSKFSKGKSLNAELGWSYYLPKFHLFLDDKFKINTGYKYRYNQHSIQLVSNSGSQYHNKNNYGLSGIYLGLDGELKLTENSELTFNIEQGYYSHKLPGSNNLSQFKENGYKTDYFLTNYGLAYKTGFSHFNFETSINGQYTPNKILTSDYMSATGIYQVRGFKYTAYSADKVIVLRNQLSLTPYSKYQVIPYVFYDWGRFMYNDSSRRDSTISSAGIGLKATPISRLNIDIFGAQRLHNRDLDHLDNRKESDKYSLWGKITYSF